MTEFAPRLFNFLLGVDDLIRQHTDRGLWNTVMHQNSLIVFLV